MNYTSGIPNVCHNTEELARQASNLVSILNQSVFYYGKPDLLMSFNALCKHAWCTEDVLLQEHQLLETGNDEFETISAPPPELILLSYSSHLHVVIASVIVIINTQKTMYDDCT